MDNDQRKLLGLEVLRDSDTAVPLSANEAEEIHVYIREHTIIKLTQSTPSQYREIDYDIPVDAEHRLIGRKGSKPKPLTFVAIEKCKTKKMRLTIDRRFNRYKVKIGVTHFQVMDVQQELPAIEGLEQTLIAQYGSLEQWEQVRNLSMKKVKLRYTPKEGDIFSYPVDEKHYGFALIIGCFSRFRKKGIMPSDRKHYLNLMMGVPLLIRTFDFVSEKKLIDPQQLRAYPLLNPEILMDDYVLRGKFPVIGKTAITLDDLVLPMSFSFNGPHTTYAGYEAYHGTQWETLQRLQDQIVVRFDWGFGSATMAASEFVKQDFDEEPTFQSLGGLGLQPCSMNKGRLSSPHTVFSQQELKRIFDWLKIDSAADYDSFSQAYGGITRQAYIEDLRERSK